MKKYLNQTFYFIPLLVFLVFWEFMSRSSTKINFLFASPISVITKLIEKTFNGELIGHTLITGFESLTGMLIGILFGSSIGFWLLYNKQVSKISQPYIIALSSIPIFGIAPMMIIWFGTGIEMKIAMAFFSTVFVALQQAYQGGKSISKGAEEYFYLNLVSPKKKFFKLTLPSSISWVIQSLKLNSGLAILGAFIGEFIAAEKGLGYIILKAGGLYDIPFVLASIVCIIFLTLFFNLLINLVEKNSNWIIRKVAIDKKSKR